MKVFISADIEGVNGINTWDDTNIGSLTYSYYKKQLTDEVLAAVSAINKFPNSEIFIKDGHDSGMNLDPSDFPDNVVIHRGWEGSPLQMMEGLNKTFDAIIFIGYHSANLSKGNALAHTMNPEIHKIKINDQVASEFLINAFTARLYNVPIAFLSGDEEICNVSRDNIKNLLTVATKTGVHGATVSYSPHKTNQLINDLVKESLDTDLRDNFIDMPLLFKIEIEYRNHKDAYFKSFYPKAKLINDNTLYFESDNYYEVLRLFQFVL
jgi:D-amino peptidase